MQLGLIRQLRKLNFGFIQSSGDHDLGDTIESIKKVDQESRHRKDLE